jgi:hypothetical protein
MKFILTCCFIILFIPGKGQNKKLQSLSGELGKNGLIFSIIYDCQLSKSQFGFRTGAGTSFGKYVQGHTITAGGYKLLGKGKEFFELGIDVQYLSVTEVSDDQRGIPTIYPDYQTTTLYPSLNIGYRKCNSKSLFRVGIAPGFTNDGFLPGVYISLGIKL